MSASVLVVDDEKNIRFTLGQVLETMGLDVQTAVNGEEALSKLEERNFQLLLLDLKMPGMDGMDVLRRVRQKRPDIRVVILTAHGNVDNAVEAMKLGAVDFLQKPFSPAEIRELVSGVLDRDRLQEEQAIDYKTAVELAKKSIGERHFDAAEEHARRAIAIDASKAEAYNLLGALLEIRRKWLEAQKYYRVALELEPRYKPAWANLERVTSMDKSGPIVLGEPTEEESR